MIKLSKKTKKNMETRKQRNKIRKKKIRQSLNITKKSFKKTYLTNIFF